MKMEMVQRAYDILTDENFAKYCDGDLRIGFDGSLYGLYVNSISDYNKIADGLTVDDLNEEMKRIFDYDEENDEDFDEENEEEMTESEVIERLSNILEWCNNNQAYEDAEALEIAIAAIRDKEG